VVVVEGDTLTLPDAPEMPTRLFAPLSITMEVASLVIQLSVAELPAVIFEVERYNAATGGEPDGGAAATASTCEL
jgi:hypothetical protein